MREEAQEDWVPTSGKSVRIVRPLRDLGMKECAAHAWWKQLSVVGKEKWPNAKQSIGGLTKGTFHVFCVSNEAIIDQLHVRVHSGFGERLPFNCFDHYTNLC